MNIPTTRREFATRTAAEIRAALTARSEALTTNEADSQRLGILAAEIADGETRLDPENLGEIQLLGAKREQLSRLNKKLAADSAARLAGSEQQLRAAMPADRLTEFFHAEHAALLNRFADAMKPFIRNREQALRIARETDSARQLGRLIYLAVNTLPLSPDETLAALDGVAKGKPPWFFD